MLHEKLQSSRNTKAKGLRCVARKFTECREFCIQILHSGCEQLQGNLQTAQKSDTIQILHKGCV